MSLVGIISPSGSFNTVSEEDVVSAKNNLKKAGVTPIFFHASTKLEELYAGNDADIDLLMASRGGFDSIELLPEIDFNRLKKPLCGYSDITVLLNAFLCKTGKIQYLGPNLKSLANADCGAYSIANFKKTALLKEENIYQPSPFYVDEHFDKNKKLSDNRPLVVNEGEASGILVGGNLCSQILLMASGFYPVFDDMIVIAEEDDMNGSHTSEMFFRNLYGLFCSPFAQKIKGLVIGRFQKKSAIDDSFVQKLKNCDFLNKIPVVMNFDTGHTLPMTTIPLGKNAELSARKNISLRF